MIDRLDLSEAPIAVCAHFSEINPILTYLNAAGTEGVGVPIGSDFRSMIIHHGRGLDKVTPSSYRPDDLSQPLTLTGYVSNNYRKAPSSYPSHELSQLAKLNRHTIANDEELSFNPFVGTKATINIKTGRIVVGIEGNEPIYDGKIALLLNDWGEVDTNKFPCPGCSDNDFNIYWYVENLWRLCVEIFCEYDFHVKHKIMMRGRESRSTHIEMIDRSILKSRMIVFDWKNDRIIADDEIWNKVKIIIQTHGTLSQSEKKSMRISVCKYNILSIINYYQNNPMTKQRVFELQITEGLNRGDYYKELSLGEFETAWDQAVAENRKTNPESRWGKAGRPRN